ncbi:hypothetical protein HELRODRAFT_162541 [Helobdella robusta]|uniref:Uncharacterized protein n=1 Tax=Helobdella robusta TaxID=6412 RepID=T1EST5_HELRO|nr:hypothetical protein HELRODRAFT_162541 [Helobdella robusta]ESN99060.1 hypothetical protein HELRODRAFT_162541 [Helobdella robusta]
MSTTQETKTISSSSAKPKILTPKPILSSPLTPLSASVETSQTEPSNRDDVSHHVHAATSPLKKPRRLIRVTSNEITSNGNDDNVDSILTFNNKFKKISPQYITNNNEKVDTNNFSYHVSNNNDDKPISYDVIMNDSNNNNNNNNNNNYSKNNKNNVNENNLKSHNDISSNNKTANTSIHSRNDLKASSVDECRNVTSNKLTSGSHVRTRVDGMVPSTKGQSNNVDDVILLMARENCDDRSARCEGVSVHESGGGDCNYGVCDAWEGDVSGGRSRDGIDKDDGKDNHKNIDNNRKFFVRVGIFKGPELESNFFKRTVSESDFGNYF